MKSSSRQIKFKDFITLQRGFDLPKKNREPGPYPVIASTSVTDTHSDYKVDPPGVVTGRSGSLGTVQYINQKYWPLNTALWVRDFKGNFPRYVYYYLQTLHLEHFNSGAGVPTLNRNHLNELEISVHDLPSQRRIAAILSAYDDLIENNTRRIALLERMAQLLYREWFVHFRFPGHEDVEMVETPPKEELGSIVSVGEIPSGWEVKLVDEAIETLGGGTPRTKNPDYWENPDITWFTPSDLTASGMMFISESGRKINALGLKKSSAKMFPAHSVMMTSRATVGVVAINTTPACTNQGFITCIPTERLSAYYLYFWVIHNREEIIRLASGATYKEINKSTFRSLPIIVPDEETHSKFVEMIEPFGQEIQNLIRRNRLLRRARDLLLPRLISSEVDVSNLKVNTGDAYD